MRRWERSIEIHIYKRPVGEGDVGMFHANGSAVRYFANVNCNRSLPCQRKINEAITMLYLGLKGFFVR
jgi:hypothetical protein